MTASIINKTIRSADLGRVDHGRLRGGLRSQCRPRRRTTPPTAAPPRQGDRPLPGRDQEARRKPVAVFSDNPFSYTRQDGRTPATTSSSPSVSPGSGRRYTSVDPAPRVDVLTSSQGGHHFAVADERREGRLRQKPYMKVARHFGAETMSPRRTPIITDVSQLEGKTISARRVRHRLSRCSICRGNDNDVWAKLRKLSSPVTKTRRGYG